MNPSASAHHSLSNNGMSRGVLAHNLRVDPARNFSGDKRNNFRGEPAPCFELTTNDWNSVSSEAFKDHMNRNGLSNKEMGKKIGCSDRTIENYLSGKTAPAGTHFLHCFAVIPEFNGLVRRVCGLMADLDPLAERAMYDLYVAAQRLTDLRAARQAPPANDHADDEPDLFGGRK